MADRLRCCLKQTDVAARLGGDEFAVIQTAVKDQSETTRLVERIYHAIRQPLECLDHIVTPMPQSVLHSRQGMARISTSC
jgi:GGDEF domain-containing protein